MPIKMPRTLDIPNIEMIETIEDIKEWLREFSELMLLVFEHSKADVQVIDVGDYAYFGDSETNGSWRFQKMADGTFELQKRVSGTWETVGVWAWT